MQKLTLSQRNNTNLIFKLSKVSNMILFLEAHLPEGQNQFLNDSEMLQISLEIMATSPKTTVSKILY